MKKQLIYIFILILAVVACEEIYNPVLQEVDDLLVVEAILISNQTENYIHLYKTLGFNEATDKYERVSGADVYLINVNNVKTECIEYGTGNYLVNMKLNSGEEYSLLIELEGEIFESDFQVVPEKPEMNSLYYDFVNRTTTLGTANSTDNIVTERGIQFYADMNNEGILNHYRFSSRKVLQYFDYYDTIIPPLPEPMRMPIYSWNSYYPTGVFNVAGPPEYSTSVSITKHELEFFESNYNKFIVDTMTFAGWIYFIYQYGINEDTYNYYSDLNSQLDAAGRIFDPVYAQVQGNITCTSNPKKVVLGNFEISSFVEKRYFLNYSRVKDTVTVFKNIPYFYDVPERGSIKDNGPDFWETTRKDYPND